MRKLVLTLATMAGLTASVITYEDVITIVSVFQEKQYKKINVASIPKDTLDKIKKNYGNYTVKEAYKADDGEYKLVLSKDGVDLTRYFYLFGRPDKNTKLKKLRLLFLWVCELDCLICHCGQRPNVYVIGNSHNDCLQCIRYA